MQNMEDFQDFSKDIEASVPQEIQERKVTDPKLSILMLQMTACLILAAMALSIKFLGGDFYAEVRTKYIEMFEDNTDVNEVLNLVGSTSSEPPVVTSTPVTSAPPVTSQPPVTSEETVTSAPEEKEELAVKVSANANAMCMPTSGEVSSEYGWRVNPVTGIYTLHSGIDIAADSGTKVFAAMNGVVSTAEYNSGLGKHVVIEHKGGLKSIYAHLSEIKCEKGDNVAKGDVIGLVGNTGRSTGPHLHFEVLKDGESMNPRYLLPFSFV